MDKEAALLRALADPARLRLAILLAANGETCVCRLAKALRAPDFKISRQLGILKRAGAAEARREGTWIHYKLARPRNALEKCLQRCLVRCLARNKTVSADIKRLKKALPAGRKRK